MKSQLYAPREYRQQQRPRLPCRFNVLYEDSDLWIAAGTDLSARAEELIRALRCQIESHIARCPPFLTSLTPLPDDPTAPPIIREMLAAGQMADVGPMAAVAGAIAEAVGRELLKHSAEVIVANGGDLFLKHDESSLIGVHAGASPLSGRIAFAVDRPGRPFGLCTSSGTVGHSLSFGLADAVTVLADDAAVADAFATAVGNRVRANDDIGPALAYAREQPQIAGCAIIVGDAIGLWGGLRAIRL